MEKLRPIVAAANGKRISHTGPKAVKRGLPDIFKFYTDKCSCKRGKSIVFCRMCGYYCHGRIRIECTVHPRVTFLLDISECPRCHSASYLDEHIYKC